MLQPWHIVVHVNANTEVIDGPALMAFRERCEIQHMPDTDPLAIPPQFRRKSSAKN